ncbi:MAG: hypothetical protein ABI614_02315 [Planctomycetota bacterium]
MSDSSACVTVMHRIASYEAIPAGEAQAIALRNGKPIHFGCLDR